MDVDGEVDDKKKLDQRMRKLIKQMRRIDEFADMPRNVVDEHREMATETARYGATTKLSPARVSKGAKEVAEVTGCRTKKEAVPG